MKKNLLIGLLFLGISLYANEVLYSSSVKNLYTSPDSNSVKGRLLPTSKVNVLGKSGDKIEVSIEGFMKEGVPNALYFVKGKRVLVAGLSKRGKFEIKKLSSSKDENGVAWSKVTLKAYTYEKNLTKDLDALFKEGQTLFKNNCALCHAIHPTTEYTANQWPSMFKAMVGRTAITKEKRYLVTQYLQKHAKDMKGE